MEPSYDDGPGRSFGAPDLSLTGSIDRLALERAVAALPAGYRLIFVLHDVEGFDGIMRLRPCLIVQWEIASPNLHKARPQTLRDALRISHSGRETGDDHQTPSDELCRSFKIRCPT